MTVTINALAGNAAEIALFGEITADAASDFDERLKSLGRVRSISLRIHSPGGNLFAALAMYNAIKRHPARVTAYIDGVAASAASFIAMAADEIRIAANSQLMIHDPHAAVSGSSAEMRRMGGLLDSLRDTMVAAYADRSRLSRSDVARMMEAETWFDAEKAVEVGLADAVDEPVAIAAVDLSRFGFRHAPSLENPKNIAEFANAFWASKGKPVEQSDHKPSEAPDLVVEALSPREIFTNWNQLSPRAKACRGLSD